MYNYICTCASMVNSNNNHKSIHWFDGAFRFSSFSLNSIRLAHSVGRSVIEAAHHRHVGSSIRDSLHMPRVGPVL